MLFLVDVKDYGKFPEVAKQVASSSPSGLNLLINNAGVASQFIKFNQLNFDDVKNNLETNLIAPLFLTKVWNWWSELYINVYFSRHDWQFSVLF